MVIKPTVTVNGVEAFGNEKNTFFNTMQLIGEIIVLILKSFYFLFESIVKKCLTKGEVSVEGKIVLITGTGHGIGRELALKYASEGAVVVGVDINEINNDKTISDIKKGGNKAYAYTCDISNRNAVFELLNKVKEEVGVVNILVNNAGIMPTKPLLKQTENEIDKTMKINVYAHFWLLQAFLPDMIKNDHGHIVALSSCAGLFGVANLVPYCASKFAVRGLMESMALELRDITQKTSNIKFTTIYPYMVDTGLCKKPKIRFENYMHMLTPKDVAETIITSQRKGLIEVTIPSIFMTLYYTFKLSPRKTALAVNDFFASGLEAED